ncbi:3'-phosphoadenosine 5'-phosphosulfate sulfotransferase [Boothiomyces macroporosus]|uniref:FAD synthase n=1 Tax=Boothiomyces macroporosus TaxID=261099 RepID=A0AAD5UBK0_9FUNG|nr:3'-phosphoadenosine 5'-phosphosulfate sulfotransferase [Boothiomyces macroporosus]
MDLATYLGNMKDTLKVFLDSNPIVQCVFIGVRKDDPYGNIMKEFQPTDGDWPKTMRVHPLLDWEYADIWDFILPLGIPYCSLYTSLGGTTNTKPNPALQKPDGTFEPAYRLTDASKERCGRF